MGNTYVDQRPMVEENVVAGIVGALLFSLVGGVLWYVLYQIGFLAGISGLVGVVCALKGYALFAKRESKKGVVISVVMAVLVMILAWYLCLANDVYIAYQDWYAAGEIDFTLTYFESVRAAYLFLMEPDIAVSYFVDLGIGLVLCAVGCGKNVIAAFRSAGAQEEAVPMPMPMPETVTDPILPPLQDFAAVPVPVQAPAQEPMPIPAQQPAQEPVQTEAAAEDETV